MLIALISVLGAGLLGIIAVLIQYLLKQNAQRADEHTATMAAIAKQGTELRDHANTLHREAMAAIAKQGEHIGKLHREAMTAIAKQGTELRDHTDTLHREAMAAMAKQGEHIGKLHREAMTIMAKQGERTAALEARAGLWEPASA